jgi:hypothetical protein
MYLCLINLAQNYPDNGIACHSYYRPHSIITCSCSTHVMDPFVRLLADPMKNGDDNCVLCTKSNKDNLNHNNQWMLNGNINH